MTVEDFQLKDPQHIVDGISHIGHIMIGLPKDTADCTNMHDDITRVSSWGSIFLNPKDALPMIFGNMMANFAPIIHDLDIINHFFTTQRHYYLAGRLMGSIMIDVLGPVPEVKYSEGWTNTVPIDTEDMSFTTW